MPVFSILISFESLGAVSYSLSTVTMAVSLALFLPSLRSRPLKYSKGIWGSAVIVPSGGVWDGAPAVIEFGPF